MPKHLPYRAVTASGNQFEFDFPLHVDTGSPVHVSNLLNALLGVLDHEIRQLGPVSNGDVLQALAMALTVRTRILPGDPGAVDALVRELVSSALAAPARPGPANVGPEAPREIH
jgi:hypothetical protein